MRLPDSTGTGGIFWQWQTIQIRHNTSQQSNGTKNSGTDYLAHDAFNNVMAVFHLEVSRCSTTPPGRPVTLLCHWNSFQGSRITLRQRGDRLRLHDCRKTKYFSRDVPYDDLNIRALRFEVQIPVGNIRKHTRYQRKTRTETKRMSPWYDKNKKKVESSRRQNLFSYSISSPSGRKRLMVSWFHVHTVSHEQYSLLKSYVGLRNLRHLLFTARTGTPYLWCTFWLLPLPIVYPVVSTIVLSPVRQTPVACTEHSRKTHALDFKYFFNIARALESVAAALQFPATWSSSARMAFGPPSKRRSRLASQSSVTPVLCKPVPSRASCIPSSICIKLSFKPRHNANFN